jgi:uncharacterized membrane protein/glutaredoxin
VFGLPLALFGLLAYLSMVGLAIAPYLFRSAGQKELRTKIEQWTGILLFLGGTAMMVFSSYLMYLLAFEIKAVCVYCVGSAMLSNGMFVLALFGRNWKDIGQPLFSGIIVAVIVFVGTMGAYAGVGVPINASITEDSAAGGYGLETSSGPAEIGLAEHLTRIGAKMYGAFTCPHCQNQKHLFGREAAQRLNYVECHPQGINSQTEACQAAGIEGFPTWEINGQKYTGEKTLVELADLSGYQGPRNFQNTPQPGH